MTAPRSTAPLWAQRIGITTRNQALQFQAQAMGFANRSQMERVRKEAIKVAPEQWRRALRETTAAEAAFQRGQMNEQQNTAAGRARGEYNTAVPRELRVVYSPPPIR